MKYLLKVNICSARQALKRLDHYEMTAKIQYYFCLSSIETPKIFIYFLHVMPESQNLGRSLSLFNLRFVHGAGLLCVVYHSRQTVLPHPRASHRCTLSLSS